MIIKPGPVIDFLLSNQQVRESRYIDWEKVMNFVHESKLAITW